MPYAVHKRESDEVVRYRAASLGECRIYLLRPHIFAGATMQNYMVGALRGTPLGKSKRAARMRAEGRRLPFMLPRGEKYLEKRLQFLHVDDMARLLVLLLNRPASDPAMTIMNVAGRGDSLTIRRCAELAQATIKRVPTRAAFRQVLRFLWKFGISSIPPEASPYMLGSYTMDTGWPAAVPGPGIPASDSIHHRGRPARQLQEQRLAARPSKPGRQGSCDVS